MLSLTKELSRFVSIGMACVVGSSVEFRFNDADEVIAVYSPERYGRFDGENRIVEREGHFGDYRAQDGFWVPEHGEVGMAPEHCREARSE